MKAQVIIVSALLVLQFIPVRLYPQNNQIDSSIAEFMTQNHIPGFGACVVANDSIVWSGAYGKADIDDKVPMSLDGIMNIGSISKTFTATAAMQLWEDGLLDLNADVSDYVGFRIRNPGHPEVPITIFQILTHTSSIRDGESYGDSYACGDPTMSLQDWIFNNLSTDGKYFRDGDSFEDWAPGDKGMYSNVAFGLLGLIVEKMSGSPFNEYCRENIFDPLGMASTGWFLSEIDTTRYIRPYGYITAENKDFMMMKRHMLPNETEFKVGTYAEICLYSFPNYPDGLVRTSINDLSVYLRAILNGGELNGHRILEERTLQKMLTAQIDENSSMGLCWHSVDMDLTEGKRTLWGHTGGDPGITTYLFFDPIEKMGVITFQNHDSGGTDTIVKELFSAASNK